MYAFIYFYKLESAITSLPPSLQLTPDQMNRFRQTGLQSHNLIRKLYNISGFKLDDKINGIAQNWSNKLAIVNNGLKHSFNPSFGENIFCICSYGSISNITGTIKVYDNNSNHHINLYRLKTHKVYPRNKNKVLRPNSYNWLFLILIIHFPTFGQRRFCCRRKTKTCHI